MSTSLKVNFAKIVDVQPSPISCMSLNHRSKKLAFFRGGQQGAIEIWDVNDQPFLQKVIFELERIDGKGSVESIIWVNNRLFSCGLHGFVIEHDICTGKIMHKSSATSGSVWCLGVNPDLTVLAAGTEDGFVNLFQIEEKSLCYIRVLDRQDGRVLCLHWSPCGRYIATGSIDSVRLWDVNKGHAVQRLNTGRTKNKETIVWSILVLEGLTIVTGDSRGIISFWDGKIGVLRFKVQSHKADVLALRLSSDKLNIYAAGVDPIILSMTRISGSDRWVKSHPRNVHINDVLTLETYGNRLFSGGIDTDLCMSSFPPKVISKFPNVPNASAFSGSDNLLLIKNASSVVLWRLPCGDEELTKLIQLESKGDKNIFSSAINPRGTLFGYSTCGDLRLFHLSFNIDKSPTLEKVHLETRLDDDEPFHMQFINELTILLISSSQVAFVQVDSKSKTATLIFDEEWERLESNLGIGLVSATSSKFCISLDNRVIIYDINEDFRISKCCDLPTHSALPSSIALHPTENLVLVTYVDHTVVVFNYETGKFVFKEMSKKKVDDLQPFLGSCWSGDGQVALLYQNDCLFMLEMASGLAESKKVKKSLKDCDRYEFQLKCCGNKYKYLAYVKNYNEGQEFVAVEIDPNCILELLPPAFSKKRFGA